MTPTANMSATGPSLSARRLVERAVAAGADRSDVLARARIQPGELERTDRVMMASLYRLWEIAVEATGDRSLPLRIAQEYDVGTYDVLGFACSTASDVETALGRLSRFLGLWVKGEWIELVRSDEGLWLNFHHELGPTRGRELAAESSLAKILFATRRAVEGRIEPVEVTFAHAVPADRSEHDRLFGCPLRFEADRYAIHYSPADMRLPLVRSDAQLAGFFERHAHELLARDAEKEATETARQVREIVADCLPSGPPMEADVAERLGWSARTLRRRLTAEGTSFREVLDEVRQSLAERYLAEPHMTIEETAFLVGFSDPSNFFRAFKRWTGQTPASFRRRVLR